MAKKKAASLSKTKESPTETAPLPITQLAEMPRGGHCCSGLVFSSDDRHLAAWAGDANLHLYDVLARKRRFLLSDHTGGIDDVAFSPDSRWMASVGERKANRRAAGGELLVWSMDTGTLLHRVPLLADSEDVSLGPVLFAPSGKQIVCVTLDYDNDEAQIVIVDADSGKVTGEIPLDDEACELAFSPDGRTLAGAFDDRLVLWQFPSGKQSKEIGRDARTSALRYSPDGKTIAVAEQSGVTLYDAASGRSSASLRESPPRAVDKLQFSADGKRLATIGVTMHGTSEGEVRLWDLKSRRVLLGFPGRTGVESPQGFPGACALTTDFSLFANAGRKVRLWQVSEEAARKS